LGIVENILGAYVAVYLREEKYLEASEASLINDQRARWDQKLAKIIDRGFAEGVFHTEDVRITTLAIGGMLSWMFGWYRVGGRLTDEELASKMAHLALKMLALEK
jgi:hypothetical protein